MKTLTKLFDKATTFYKAHPTFLYFAALTICYLISFINYSHVSSDHYYQMNGTIVKVEAGTYEGLCRYTVEDEKGLVFSFEDNDGYRENEEVLLTLYNNQTVLTRKDDMLAEVTSVKYFHPQQTDRRVK